MIAAAASEAAQHRNQAKYRKYVGRKKRSRRRREEEEEEEEVGAEAGTAGKPVGELRQKGEVGEARSAFFKWSKRSVEKGRGSG